MAAKIPQVMGLVLCDEFDVPSFALRGLFQARRFSSFPAPAKPFIVYGALYSGGSEGTIELECVRLETEDVVFRHKEWASFPTGMVTHWMLRIDRLILPAPGRYTFKLFFDGNQLTERFLEVARDKK